MKTFVALIIIALFTCSFKQDISKKEQRAKRISEKELQTEQLINSKTFVFKASRALSQGGHSVDLTTNSNGITFSPDTIESYMPFFGRAYHADLSGEGGIKFKGKAKVFKVATRKGGRGYEIDIKVPASRESYQLNLFVSRDGHGTLTITSNERSSISYFGEIEQVEKGKEK